MSAYMFGTKGVGLWRSLKPGRWLLLLFYALCLVPLPLLSEDMFLISKKQVESILLECKQLRQQLESYKLSLEEAKKQLDSLALSSETLRNSLQLSQEDLMKLSTELTGLNLLFTQYKQEAELKIKELEAKNTATGITGAAIGALVVGIVWFLSEVKL
jgi:septal ring factor EnvC (AmiA/AmiB activator)